MANISVFMESYEPTMGNHRRQMIIVKIDGNVRVYARVTDGQKGPNNRWLETDLDTLNTGILPNEMLTAEPVGVEVTLADEKAIHDNGYSAVLGTKCVSAHGKAEQVSGVIAADTFLEMYSRVLTDDSTLADLIIDQRKKVNLYTPPVINTPAPSVELTTEVEVTTHEAPVIHAALASVPPIEIHETYVHRNIIGGVEDYKAFDYARANHRNVLLYGPTGPGKTTSIQAWSAARGLRVAIISGSAALEPSHLFGKYVSDGKGGFAWVDGPVTDVVRNGGVLIFDEANFIGMKIITPSYSLLDRRRCISLLDHYGEVIEAHPDLTVFATMNPDYVGTGQLNAAFRNRFNMQIPWDYDPKVEAQLVKHKNLLVLANQLRAEAAKGQYETPIATNMLMEFGDFVDGLGYEFAVENFIAHFADEEQASVRLVFQTHEYNLKGDFGIAMDIKFDNPAESGTSDESGTTTITI
jgi:hypothetical protein